jgi:hypothetical protein
MGEQRRRPFARFVRSLDTRSVGDLSDAELDEELLVAAMARGQRRLDRYRRLFEERQLRRDADGRIEMRVQEGMGTGR